MFVIDFDDTLFDTQRFKEARCQALLACGVSAELFWETYRQARTNSAGRFTYSNERHAAILGERGYDRAEIIRAFEQMGEENSMRSFLFKDAVFFLDYLQSRNRPLVLLSLGDPATQERKVRGVGIHDYFDRVFFVDAGKEIIVSELMGAVSEKDAWFINDKIGETAVIRERFPAIRCVLKEAPTAPREEYDASGLPHFRELLDIAEYVKTEFK